MYIYRYLSYFIIMRIVMTCSPSTTVIINDDLNCVVTEKYRDEN